MDKKFKTNDIYMVRLAKVEEITWTPENTSYKIKYKKFPYTYYAIGKKLLDSTKIFEIFSTKRNFKYIDGDVQAGDVCVYIKLPISLLLKDSDKKTIKLSTLLNAEKELNRSVGAPLGKESPIQLSQLYNKKQERVRQF